jgi:glutathione synthase/RimK-type ligase-like ATP-grasp enzyme
MHIAIVTAASAAGTDEDEPLLLAALRAAGAAVDVAVWDDEGVAWDAYDVAVIRSTWDYSTRRAEFLDWARHTAGRTRLRNGPDVLAWNTDKTYLRELAGVPVVPTTFLEPGDDVALPAGVELVVKPSVSAGSRNTARHAPDALAAAVDHAEQLLAAGRTVMVQPYQASVDTRGETALLYVGGRFSHAANKGALLTPGNVPSADKLFATEKMSAVEPTAAEREVAEAVLDAAPFPRSELLYARVDLVAGPDGSPLLLELELAEPSMFLPQAPPAATAAFAAAVLDV